MWLIFQPAPNLKHDWYQTEVAVVITVLVKNVKPESLKIDFTERYVTVNLNLDEHQHELKFNLAHKIVPEQCSYKITPSKVNSNCFSFVVCLMRCFVCFISCLLIFLRLDFVFFYSTTTKLNWKKAMAFCFVSSVFVCFALFCLRILFVISFAI